MLILGITNNDVAGACLVENGKILSAIYEERFTRIKSHKVWPQRSIDFVLGANSKTLADVDLIAYGWSAGFNEEYCLELYVDRLIEESWIRPDSVQFCKKRILDELHNDKEKRQEFDNYITSNNFKNKVVYIDHHDCHAWASYLCSPFDTALVVMADGRGDYRSLTVRLITEDRDLVA